jgi:Rhodanese-like domain
MKIFLVLSLVFVTNNPKTETPSKVDFDAFETLTHEVNGYRKDRLINFETFKKYAKAKGTVVLDTRSKAMFDRKHIKGAINLNFSDFTQDNLDQIFPSEDTRILIYCNNNIDNDPIVFTSKVVLPKKLLFNKKVGFVEKKPGLTLALNVPTFINLYGYGYKNVYELSELVSVNDNRIQFEGTDVLDNQFRIRR